MREKSCPRCAFLGLCEKGYVEGIGPGRYSAREIKKKYAVDAVDLLRKDRRVARDIELHADDTKLLATDIMNLWKKIVPVTKKHNQQMHVVVALWNKKLIKAT